MDITAESALIEKLAFTQGRNEAIVALVGARRRSGSWLSGQPLNAPISLPLHRAQRFQGCGDARPLVRRFRLETGELIYGGRSYENYSTRP